MSSITIDVHLLISCRFLLRTSLDLVAQIPSSGLYFIQDFAIKNGLWKLSQEWFWGEGRLWQLVADRG